MNGQFGPILSAFVKTYSAQTGSRKKDIAKAAGYSASMFSQILSGYKQPRSKTAILAIASALDLDRDNTNRLLLSAGFETLTGKEEKITLPRNAQLPRRLAATTLTRLHQPERSMLILALDQDVTALMDSWESYQFMREDLFRGDWPAVEEHFALGYQQYHQLRSIAARYLAHLYLTKAAAEEYAGKVEEAEQSALKALQAAQVARDSRGACMVFYRLGAIATAKGEIRKAVKYYDSSRRALYKFQSEIHPNRTDQGLRLTKVVIGWCEFWQHRLRRQEGQLAILEGKPGEARDTLEESLSYFKRMAPGASSDSIGESGSRELIASYYLLGWACSLLGLWDDALEHHKEGLALADAPLRNYKKDPQYLLQGHLYLGGDYLDRREYSLALHHLNTARKVLSSEPKQPMRGGKEIKGLEGYHEVGRISQLLGKVYTNLGQWEEAERCIWEGVEFYSNSKPIDTVRLAAGYNILGGLFLRRGKDGDVWRARSAFEDALAWATRAGNPHYQVAARVNRCRTLLDTEEAADELFTEILELDRLCRQHSFSQHLARLKLIECAMYAGKGDNDGWLRAACAALNAAVQFNRFLIDEIWTSLRAMPVEAPQYDRLTQCLPPVLATWEASRQ